MSEMIHSDLPEAVMKKRRKFSVIWLIPIIAVGIGAWLIYQTVVERGIPITISFKNGEGLVSKKTFIHHKGVEVGLVDDVELGPDLKEVIVKATLDKSAAGLAREGTGFWIVRPRVGPAGITGLDTLVSGVYIAASPGTGEPTREFIGLNEPQVGSKNAPGLNVVLTADRLGSLQVSSPVYYREIQVGIVENYGLAEDSEKVEIYIHIDDRYAPLIRQNTRFWNASGIKMETSLLGMTIKTESLASVLAGGIAFATPNNKRMGPPSKHGDVFKLHDAPEKSWLKWRPEIPLKNIKK